MPAYRAAPAVNKTADAEPSERNRSSRTSTTGCPPGRSAQPTNAPSSAIPASSGTPAPAWPIPPSWERFDRPSRIAARAGPSRPSPIRSSRARPAPGEGWSAGQQPPGEHQPDRDHRHVDQEQPAPAEPVEYHPADHRAEDRPERQRQAHRGDQAAACPPARGPDRQRLHQREDQAGGEPLHHPEPDQAGVVPGHRAQDRPDHEQQQRRHPDPLAAPPGLRPPGDRDRHRHRQQVAGRHPLDRPVGRVQADHQRVQRDGDHRRVQDRRDTADDQRQQGVPDRRGQLRRLGRPFNHRLSHPEPPLLDTNQYLSLTDKDWSRY